MRLAWATDIHLNFVDAETRRRFLDSVAGQADALAISGDIGESPDVQDYLRECEDVLQRPVFFVLGNHDFYKGSIATTREDVARLAASSDHLVYLTAGGVIELSDRTALIGHDGWADARLGDFDNSDVVLNDYVLITELRKWSRPLELDKRDLREALHGLGDQAAAHFEYTLGAAVQRYPQVIAITHVPPFPEAVRHGGRTADDSWLPHFSCKAVGDVLLQVMQGNPQSSLLVLCGHTHGGGELQLLDNLRVLTGEADYGAPAIQRVFDVA